MTRHPVIFAVTNDLVYDQRMQRICSSLATAGYPVTLVGIRKKHSPPLEQANFREKRISVLFTRGKLFYLEYNFKLFWWLLFQKASCLTAIDLDTIVPVYWVSKCRGLPRVYDAHELFCEMKEVVSRPPIYRFWKWIEQHFVPKFSAGYTVSQPIADIFNHDYGLSYPVIRNMPILQPSQPSPEKEPYLLYQGAVNEGRLFEVLIPAMQWVDRPLWIFGDGNFLVQARDLIRKHGLEDKVFLKGKLEPSRLREITNRACLGFTLFENRGLSNYYSLANRFFDYVHSLTPQLCSDFPLYRELNNSARVAVLVNTTDPATLAKAINALLSDSSLYRQIQENCRQMRMEWNWPMEEKKLLAFYHKLLPVEG